MKRLWMLGLAVMLVPGLAAQERDSTRQRAEAERLRAQIEQRFAERVRDQLNLSPDQLSKLQATHQRFGTQRRELIRQQMLRRRALEDQMQPGVAANADSVRKLMDATQAGRAEMLKIEQEEDRELAGYLTPVQRARYLHMRERLMQRVNELRQERRGRRGDGIRPGQRPRPRGGQRPT